MSSSVKLIGLLVVLLGGSAGWGLVATAALGRWSGTDVRARVGPALRVAIGVALFLAVSGVLVALGIAHPWILLGWHVVGAGVLAASLVVCARRGGAPSRRMLVFGAFALLVAAFVVVALIGNALQRLPYNVYDDDGAYVYLAERLARTGGLIDAFNQRRLVSYGGGTVYHALFDRYLGNGTLMAFDQVFGVLLVVMLSVWRRGRRGTVVVGAGLAVVVALGRGAGLITNVTPVLLAVALSIATLQLVELTIDSTSVERQRVFFPLLGLVLAGLLSLRFTFVVPVAIALAIAIPIAARRLRSVGDFLPIAAWTVACSAGWAIALQRSSGTPVFPMIAGNYDTTWPGGKDPNINTIGKYTDRILDVFRSGDVGLTILATLLIAVVLGVLQRRRSGPVLVIVGAAAGCAVQVVVITYTFSGAALYNLQRFVAPSVTAAALYTLDVLWRPAHGASAVPPPSAGRQATWMYRASTRPVSVVASVVLSVVIALMVFGSAPWDYVTPFRDRLNAGRFVLQHDIGFGDRYEASRPEYARLERSIPAGSKVLVAANLPQLFDPNRDDLSTLDIAGSVSPSPHLPFFRGTAAKLRYLRAQGFDYVVAQDPETDIGMYSRAGWQANLDQPVGGVRGISDVRWSRYMLDWMDDIEHLAAQHGRHVREFGHLLLIPVTPPSRPRSPNP